MRETLRGNKQRYSIRSVICFPKCLWETLCFEDNERNVPLKNVEIHAELIIHTMLCITKPKENCGNSELSGSRLGSRELGVTDCTFGILTEVGPLWGALGSLGLKKSTLSCSKGRGDVRAISEKAAPVQPVFYLIWSLFKQTSDLACDFSQVLREFSPLLGCEGVEEALAGSRAAVHTLKCRSEDKTQRGQTMGGEPGLVNRP